MKIELPTKVVTYILSFFNNGLILNNVISHAMTHHKDVEQDQDPDPLTDS